MKCVLSHSALCHGARYELCTFYELFLTLGLLICHEQCGKVFGLNGAYHLSEPEARHNNYLSISISASTSVYVQTCFCVWERGAFLCPSEAVYIENMKKVVLVLALQPFF